MLGVLLKDRVTSRRFLRVCLQSRLNHFFCFGLLVFLWFPLCFFFFKTLSAVFRKTSCISFSSNKFYGTLFQSLFSLEIAFVLQMISVVLSNKWKEVKTKVKLTVCSSMMQNGHIYLHKWAATMYITVTTAFTITVHVPFCINWD